MISRILKIVQFIFPLLPLSTELNQKEPSLTTYSLVPPPCVPWAGEGRKQPDPRDCLMASWWFVCLCVCELAIRFPVSGLHSGTRGNSLLCSSARPEDCSVVAWVLSEENPPPTVGPRSAAVSAVAAAWARNRCPCLIHPGGWGWSSTIRGRKHPSRGGKPASSMQGTVQSRVVWRHPHTGKMPWPRRIYLIRSGWGVGCI